MSRVLGDVFQILNGNVGLGTTIPRQLLDIQDGNGIISGNLGIGTTYPQYAIDAVGDVNFTGILRQSGTPYVSSQWTTNGTSVYYSSGNVGIYTDQPQNALHVIGDIRASRTVYASNLQIAGSLNILDTTTSNTQQLIIINNGSGPALIAKQTGVNYVAQFYHDDTEVFTIADGGLIGINTATPRAPLDIIGDTILTGNIGFGTTQALARLYLRHFDTGIDDILRVDNTNTNTTSLMINHNGNVGIGTSTPMYPFHVVGSSYLNGPINTNNNNINAGSGTVTATTFSGTATKVSQDLIKGNYLTGANYNGVETTTWNVDADTAATANKVVVRDTSGYIFASGVGIGTATLNSTLHVVGNILTTGTITASNLTVLGDTTILNTISSNTEQMVITNAGTGPALKVTQSGINSVAEFYDNESGLALMIANNGNIGIGSTTPYNALDINGNMYINGTITTNNNNINAGSGTVTATTFSGTATQVSNDLSPSTYLIGTIYNGVAASSWSVDATDANTANKVVARDASGNFSAGTITATLSGTATQVSQNLTRGTYLTGANYNGSVATTWAVDADTAATANKVVVRDASAYMFASGVGIGTATARQLLDVQGGHAIISGNLGIGTTNPTVRLSVGTGPSDVTSTLMFNSGDTATNTDKLYWTYIKNGSRIGHNGGWNVNHYAGQSNTSAAPSNGNFHFFTGGPEYNERLTILNNGNIGIGSTQPAYRLDVAGNAYINGAITTNNNNINAGTGTVTAATFSGTATKVSNDLIKGTYLTGTNYNGSVATTWAVDADSAAVANKVVVRDVSGNFSAGTITATLSGTATQVSQDLNRGSYLIGDNYNGSVATTWAVDADSAAVANKVVVRDANGMIYAANVGVGTTSALYAVDVVGDVNFTGILRQSGTPYVSSQWTTAGANIYYSTGNVGVGTTAPLYTIDAAGDINFTGTLYQNGTPFSGGGGSSQWTTSGLNIYYSTGNVGIGTNNPLNYSLNVNGDSYLKKVVTSNLVILQEPSAYFQITPVRKVYYIDTASQSIFNVNVVGIYGGVASNVQCFVNNNLLSYYSSNIKDYDISYTHSTPSNLTIYTITLTSPATYGSIVDITVTPQIITETDLSNNLFYQNVSVYTYFNQYGNNIAYTNGNVGLGTTDPLQSLHVQNQSYFVGNVGLGTTVPLKLLDIRDDAIISGRIGIGTTNPLQSLHVQNQSYFVGNVGLGTTVPLKLLDIRDDAIVSGRIGIGTTNPLQSLHVQNESYFVGNVGIGTTVVQNAGGGLHIFAPKGTDGNGTSAQLIVENDATDVGAVDYDARIIIKSKQTGESELILYNVDDGVIDWAKVGLGTKNISFSIGNNGTVNAGTSIGSFNPETCYFDSANVGIGTTIPLANLAIHGTTGVAVSGYKQFYIAHPVSTNYGWYLGNQTQVGTATDLDFYFAVNRNGTITEPAFIQDNVALTQMNFTGQHKCFLKDMSSNEISQYNGLIVSANQNKYIRMSNGIAIGKEAITISESLPIVTITTTSNDKSVMGVISDVEDAERRKEEYGAFVTLFKKEKGDTRAYINSLGEGAIWVSDINGSLESGDYITSSAIAGYGMKQNDDLLHNYTVAKITMNCDFNPATIPKYQVKKDPITQENILDAKGNLQWEEVKDDNGNIIYEKEYDIRYLLLDGTHITEAQYNDALNNQISVYKAAFVGCTYHCG